MIEFGMKDEIPAMIEASKPKSILSLPKKVRENIYKLVLAQEGKEVCLQPATLWEEEYLRDLVRDKAGRLGNYRHYGCKSTSKRPALLQSSRHVRKEAMAIYCEMKLFTIYVCPWKFPHAQDQEYWSVTPYPDFYATAEEKHKYEEHTRPVWINDRHMMAWLEHRNDHAFDRAKLGLELLGPENIRLIQRLRIRLPECDIALSTPQPHTVTMVEMQRIVPIQQFRALVPRLLQSLKLDGLGVGLEAMGVEFTNPEHSISDYKGGRVRQRQARKAPLMLHGS